MGIQFVKRVTVIPVVKKSNSDTSCKKNASCKKKKRKKINKYLDLARELKKYRVLTVIPVIVGVFRTVLKTWKSYCWNWKSEDSRPSIPQHIIKLNYNIQKIAVSQTLVTDHH